MKKISLFTLLILVSVFLLCKGDDEEKKSVSSSENFFYLAAKEVAPAFNGAASKKMTRALSPGSLIYAVFDLLRDYQYPADEGVIDMHNIYKVLYEAGQIYQTAETGCSSITEASVASPFDLGITDTYNCAGNGGTMSDSYANGFAIKDASPLKYALLTYRWAPDSPNHEEHGILQGSFNDNTGDLSLKMIHNVYYAASDGFVVRSDIEGNATTHAFTLKSITAGTGSSTSFTSIVGKGISRGSGNYFLLKVNSDTLTGRYFCIPAGATETDLELMTATGYDNVDANCSAYQADVDAMTFLEDNVSTIPGSISDFTGSTILLSY